MRNLRSAQSRQLGTTSPLRLTTQAHTMRLICLSLASLACLVFANPVARGIAPAPTLEPFPTAAATKTSTATSAASTAISLPPTISHCCCCKYLLQDRSKLSKRTMERYNVVCPMEGRACGRSGSGMDALFCPPLACPLLDGDD